VAHPPSVSVHAAAAHRTGQGRRESEPISNAWTPDPDHTRCVSVGVRAA
jgi:hypothetical protein